MRDDEIGRINGVGIVTFQYLRMQAGIDTSMPDKVIKRVLSEEFGINARDDIAFIREVERFSSEMGYSQVFICWAGFVSPMEGVESGSSLKSEAISRSSEPLCTRGDRDDEKSSESNEHHHSLQRRSLVICESGTSISFRSIRLNYSRHQELPYHSPYHHTSASPSSSLPLLISSHLTAFFSNIRLGISPRHSIVKLRGVILIAAPSSLPVTVTAFYD